MQQKNRRSRAYPVLELRRALALLERVISDLGMGYSDRDDVATAIGYQNGSTGVAGRKIAALCHFGLLDRQGRLYAPSELADALLGQSDPQVVKATLREAFQRPAVFREVLERYRDSGRVPRRLEAVLARDHGITTKAMHDAAEVFMASAQFAGVLSANGAFVDHTDTASAHEDDDRADGKDTQQRLRIALTEGKLADIEVPLNLNADDVEILKAQIDVLQRQVAANTVAGPVVRFPRR